MAVEIQKARERVTPSIQTRRSTEIITAMPLPVSLWEHLNLMRRDPRIFIVAGEKRCKAPGVRCKKSDLVIHAKGEYAGRWCPDHGWNDFNSVRFPPTERLTRSEIAERDRVKKAAPKNLPTVKSLD